MNYEFFKILANEHGTNSALLLQDIYFWLKVNLKNGVNIIKGLVWTYSTVKDLEERHSYLTASQIRTAISRLVRKGVLIKEFLGKGYDRTTWFSIPQEIFMQMIKQERELSSSAKNEKSICEKSQMDLLNLANDINNNINIYSSKEIKEEIEKEKEAMLSQGEVEKMESFVKMRLEKENPALLSQISRECGGVFQFVMEYLIPARVKYGDLKIRESFEKFIKSNCVAKGERIRMRFHRCFSA